MKKTILTLAAILIASLSFAQGSGFNYKALITDNGNVLSTQPVTFKFTVLENGTTSVYQETQSATTDANGIVAVNVGEGTLVSGNFATIDWGSNPYFLKVEIDTGNGYQDFGTTEFKAVPYAKFAEKAGNAFSGDFDDLSNKPVVFYEGATTTPASNTSQDIKRYGTISVGFDFTNAISGALFKANSRPTGNNDTFGFGAAIGGTGSGSHYGILNYLADNGTGAQYGIRTNIFNSGSGYHYGAFNQLSGSGSGIQYGTQSIVNNTGDAPHFGSSSLLSGSGSGTHYGTYNKLYGDGTGDQYGTLNNVYNSGDAIHYGTKNKLSGTGAGIQYGTRNYIDNSGNENHYGINNYLTGAGAGEHFGNFTTLTGAGAGNQYGTVNSISNSGDAFHYGNKSYLSGSGSGLHYGTYNELSGNGTGMQYGTENRISNTGDADHFGSHSNLSGSGAGFHYGAYNKLEGTGTGNQYGTSNAIYNSGNATHYGVHNYLAGSGTGDKYGSYNKISTSAGGTHYAVYGEAEKAGSYAGYFKGDVKITQNIIGKIKAEDSGDADMKAYIYGNITSGGSKRPAGSSDGFSVSKIGAGVYDITFASTGGSYSYTVIATIGYPGGVGFIRAQNVSATKCTIRTYNTSGTPTDKYFTFVMYKK